jgi:aromatic-amino-acid transaminase
MKAVAAAEAQLNSVDHGASVYLPMEGLLPYRTAIQHLLFGAEHPMLQQGASPPFKPWAVPAR